MDLEKIDSYNFDINSNPWHIIAGNANSIYQPTHAGWVGITSYVDSNGNTRVKTEVLVAGSSITGDAGDDQQLADSA